ncbi:MAG: ATP-dependent helicase, partial [Candidatus Omnitrophota bacterium]|nr:ATP-dependent helicase [Candidatus Omnitrophota bacterium]
MDTYKKFYKELNDRQKLAVDAIDGQFLVLAGPGTGKTQLLSVRAASILNSAKIGPENILILTYTNSAAKTMKERLTKIMGTAGYEVDVGTFHGFANSILRESDETINYIGDKILMDDVERMRVIEYILDNSEGLDDIRPFRAPYAYLKEILIRISEMKKDGITPDSLDEYLEKKESQYRYMEDKYIKRLMALSKAYRMYERLKEGGNKDVFDERGRYDFDDIILFATEALYKETALKNEYQKEYRYVMVDEFQDANDAQMKLLLEILDYDNPNLLCVGDDDQSIYRFQGASVGNFKRLAKRFPDLKTFHLKDNYRSTPELINASSKIINIIPPEERVGAKSLVSMRAWEEKEIGFHEFTTQEEELLYIVDKVKELRVKIEEDEGLTKEERRYPYNNIAILVRKR